MSLRAATSMKLMSISPAATTQVTPRNMIAEMLADSRIFSKLPLAAKSGRRIENTTTRPTRMIRRL